MVFFFFSSTFTFKAVKTILSSQAVGGQVVGWIWAVGHRVPTPDLNQAVIKGIWNLMAQAPGVGPTKVLFCCLY